MDIVGVGFRSGLAGDVITWKVGEHSFPRGYLYIASWKQRTGVRIRGKERSDRHCLSKQQTSPSMIRRAGGFAKGIPKRGSFLVLYHFTVLITRPRALDLVNHSTIKQKQKEAKSEH